jgi:hypothetical protein
MRTRKRLSAKIFSSELTQFFFWLGIFNVWAGVRLVKHFYPDAPFSAFTTLVLAPFALAGTSYVCSSGIGSVFTPVFKAKQSSFLSRNWDKLLLIGFGALVSAAIGKLSKLWTGN